MPQRRHAAMRSDKLALLRVCLSIIAALGVGCGSPTATLAQTPLPTAILTPNATPTPASTPAPASNPTVTSAILSVDNWPTYHRDLSRSGVDPGVSPEGSTHNLWTSDILNGDIYAEPLVVAEKVLVATKQDSIYSLDIQT